jgi:2-keto-4-pentenoate hydratase
MSDERIVRGMRAQLELRRRMLDDGAAPLGWKVGLNPPAIQAKLGLDGPVVGFLTDSTLVESGSTWALPSADANVVVEPEVGIEIGADGASVAALMPALEVVEFDRPLEEIEQVLGEDIFHRAVVLGPRRAIDAPGAARVTRNDEQVHDIDASGAVDGILEAVARRLGDAGEQLRPGDIVIAGALAAPVPVSPGDRVRLELDPLGAVELTFSA